MKSAALILAVASTTAVVLAQAPTQQSAPAFEVASVKRNIAPQFLRFSILPGGRLVITGHPLASIIRQAYSPEAQLVGGMPAWTQTERFDVIAQAPEGTPDGTQHVLSMLRTLLRTRFNMQARLETREVPIYALTLAKADGQLGPRLRASDADCSAFVPGRSDAPDAEPRCTIFGTRHGESPVSTYRLLGRSMPKLASDLQGFAGRPVRDHTGLAGLFDIELAFVRQGSDVSPQSDNGVSLFTAMQEQLGLKLEPARGPVEVLVIDSVERPTPD